MKQLLFILLTALSFNSTFAKQIETRYAKENDVDTAFTTIDFESAGGLYYISETPNLYVTFHDSLANYSIFLDGKNTQLIANQKLALVDLQRGDHVLSVDNGLTGDLRIEIAKKIKIKKRPPLIKNDAVVLGILLFALFLIFRTANSTKTGFKKFYRIVPALLMCYFVPAILNSIGLISFEESNLYYVAKNYLLPASLILLCLSIDLPAIKKLGSKAIIMFFAATVGIIVGGPLALWIVSLISPDVLDDEIWRGLSTVAGSWIGGGANQTAMKEIYGASDQLFSAMIIVDVFVANIFMSVLLFGTGMNKKINRFFKADDSAIESLKKKMEDFQASVSKVITFTDLVYMMGITFALVGLAHFLSGLISPRVQAGLDAMNNTFADLIVSFGNEFFWLVVLATLFGVILSFTKFRSFEGVGASKFGSLFLYILVATIGMHMDIAELIANWEVFQYLLLIGLLWISVHAIFLFAVAKLIRAPFFFVAVGSQANVGGAASAPVVASAFSPSLAPVGVLLAVLGYAVGTFGAILCTFFMQWLAQG